MKPQDNFIGKYAHILLGHGTSRQLFAGQTFGCCGGGPARASEAKISSDNVATSTKSRGPQPRGSGGSLFASTPQAATRIFAAVIVAIKIANINLEHL